MASLSRFRDDVTDDLEAQMAKLQKEVRSLRRALGKRGSAAYDDAYETASDLYEGISSHIGDALPVIRDRSRAVGRAASDHPVTTAVVGLAVIGLLVGLLARR
ncbi:hypothetical protein [Kumtagia ephedrae]|uniref:DUF883 domain-containing protein n=1 Tax=Kumtagia ephedrae TaxID=2116701 RepID=A0A2P7S0A2_9HYPH|nr:hypothetical protein [Mesorhizobium ephedrae]PSJ55900.1 hypothetical protein C7I84_22400 [Mesorhizobium ephedrae]